jgi:hypothetical protein
MVPLQAASTQAVVLQHRVEARFYRLQGLQEDIRWQSARKYKGSGVGRMKAGKNMETMHDYNQEHANGSRVNSCEFCRPCGHEELDETNHCVVCDLHQSRFEKGES